MTAPAGVPARIDDVDAGWLEQVLGGPFSSVVVEPLGDGAGFLGDLARARLVDAEGTERRVVIKVPTADPGGRRVGRLLDVWRREHLFYSELAGDLDGVVPRCLHAGADPGADRWVLVLEDLAPLRSVDPLIGMDVGDVAAVIDVLAALHARYADGAGTTPGWVPSIGADTADLLAGAVRGAIKRWREGFAEDIPPGFADQLAAYDLGGWLVAQSRRPLVMAHADVRIDNLALLVTGGVRLLDWQTAMRTNGVTDVAILCATGLTVDDRRRHEDELCKRYAEGRARHGAPVDRRLRQDLGEAFWWWSAMFANNLSTIDPPPGRARDVFASMIHRTATAAQDHST